jgi:hypothetical protein
MEVDYSVRNDRQVVSPAPRSSKVGKNTMVCSIGIDYLCAEECRCKKGSISIHVGILQECFLVEEQNGAADEYNPERRI